MSKNEDFIESLRKMVKSFEFKHYLDRYYICMNRLDAFKLQEFLLINDPSSTNLAPNQKDLYFMGIKVLVDDMQEEQPFIFDKTAFIKYLHKD